MYLCFLNMFHFFDVNMLMNYGAFFFIYFALIVSSIPRTDISLTHSVSQSVFYSTFSFKKNFIYIIFSYVSFYGMWINVPLTKNTHIWLGCASISLRVKCTKQKLFSYCNKQTQEQKKNAVERIKKKKIQNENECEISS